jgi:hypothetical protein
VDFSDELSNDLYRAGLILVSAHALNRSAARNAACTRRGAVTERKEAMKVRSLAFIVPAFAALVAVAVPAQAGQEMTLKDVPSAVRDTIHKHVGDGKLGTIERETEKDKPPVYEVEYTTADGKEYELKIAEDGKLLAKEED